MRLSTSMMTYPVFPDWIFVGDIDLDPDIKRNLMNELSNNPRTDTHYGWATDKKYFTPNLKALNQVIGSKFYEDAKAHFKLSGPLLNIEIGESWVQMVNPGHCVSATINHHRWYQSVYFFDVDDKSGSLYFEDTSTRRQFTAQGVQDFFHHIPAESKKVVYFPAHMLNGISVNTSSKPALYIVSTFIIKM